MGRITPKQNAIRIAVVALTLVPTLARWMVSSLLGFLLLLIGTYAYLRLTGANVLTMRESVETLLVLDAQILLGVAGTIGAYAIAVNTWRQQKSLELRLAAVGEISVFFTRANTLARQLATYSDQLLDLHRNLARPPAELLPFAKLLFENAPQAVATRSELSRMAIDVHDFRSRHELIITSGLATSAAFFTATTALEKITKEMWFSIPTWSRDPAAFLHNMAFVDATQLAAYRQAFDVATIRMSKDKA